MKSVLSSANLNVLVLSTARCGEARSPMLQRRTNIGGEYKWTLPLGMDTQPRRSPQPNLKCATLLHSSCSVLSSLPGVVQSR